MSTLIELIEQASSDIDTYKSPDIDECQRRLHEILQAAEYGSIMNDKIESLEFYSGMLHIETSWSARCCAQSSSYHLPTIILEAEDPIKEAKIWGVNKRIAKEEHELECAHKSVKNHEEALAKHKAELEAIML